jgi:MFS family permease
VAPISASLSRDSKIIGLVCFPHMMSHFYYMVLPPMFSALQTAYGLSHLELGAVITAFGLAAGIGQTPVGFVVDRMGALPVLMAGLAIEALAIGAIGFADAYWHLLALGAIAGLGHTVFHPADYAIMSATISKERMGRAFGFHSFTGYVGFALAPVFMTGATAVWNWRIAFALAGLLGVVGVLALWLRGDLLRGAVRGAAGPPAPKDKPAGASLREGIGLLGSLPILMCFLYFVLYQMGTGGVRTFLEGALWQLYQTPSVVAGAALTGLMIGSAVGILAGGVLVDRVGPTVMTAFLTLVPAGILIAMLGVYDLPAAGLVTVTTGAGFLIGLLIPSRDVLLRSVTPDGSMGKVMGFTSTGANIGGAITPLVLGLVLDHSDPRWVFWISALLIGVAFLTFVTVRSRFGGRRTAVESAE